MIITPVRMATHSVLVFVLLLALSQCCFSETLGEDDGLSKRAIGTQNAKTVFYRLKSSVLSLPNKPGKPGPPGRPRPPGPPLPPGSPGRPGRPGVPKFHSRAYDYVFVIDNSGSIGSRHFETTKRFVGDMIMSLPVYSSGVRVAVVTYSSNVRLEFDFSRYFHPQCARLGVSRIRYEGYLTATGTALQYVHDHLLFNSNAGARWWAKKVVFLFTDGHSNMGVRPSKPANMIKGRHEGTIYVFGVTNNVNERELLSIATSPAHVFRLASFVGLKALNIYLEKDINKRCRYGKCSLQICFGRPLRLKPGEKGRRPGHAGPPTPALLNQDIQDFPDNEDLQQEVKGDRKALDENDEELPALT